MSLRKSWPCKIVVLALRKSTAALSFNFISAYGQNFEWV